MSMWTRSLKPAKHSQRLLARLRSAIIPLWASIHGLGLILILHYTWHPTGMEGIEKDCIDIVVESTGPLSPDHGQAVWGREGGGELPRTQARLGGL